MREYLTFPQAIALAYEKPGVTIASEQYDKWIYVVSETGDMEAYCKGRRCQDFSFQDVEIKARWFVVTPEHE